MIPSLFVAMDALPLTPNGKIDRRALSQLPPPSSGFEKSYIAPRTDREKALATICEQVLHVQRVGMDDDLFSLGADSIHLFQIAARAAREGLQVAPKQLLQNRTIGALAAALDSKKTAARAASASGIVAVSRDKFRTKRTQ
jgi:aryl carrier-like protein